MVYIVTSVHDMVACKYSAIQLEVNEATAVRNFKYACEHIPNIPNTDIELVLVGTFDDSSGYIESDDKKILAHGSDFQKVGESDE